MSDASALKFAIVGNSGSGKTTLAQRLRTSHGTDVLDLDTVAWQPGQQPPQRRPTAEAAAEVHAFCEKREAWVVEGCYGSLIEATLALEPVLVFMHPGPEQCAANCRARPWEPHKYESAEAQDANLAFLLEWVAGYYARENDLSLTCHQRLFDAYAGRKHLITQLDQLNTLGL